MDVGNNHRSCFFKVDYGYIHIYDLYINNEPLETLDVGIYIYMYHLLDDGYIYNVWHPR